MLLQLPERSLCLRLAPVYKTAISLKTPTSRKLQVARAEQLHARLTRHFLPHAREGHAKTKRPRKQAGVAVFLVHENPASRPENGPDARTLKIDSACNQSTYFFHRLAVHGHWRHRHHRKRLRAPSRTHTRPGQTGRARHSQNGQKLGPGPY